MQDSRLQIFLSPFLNDAISLSEKMSPRDSINKATMCPRQSRLKSLCECSEDEVPDITRNDLNLHYCWLQARVECILARIHMLLSFTIHALVIQCRLCSHWPAENS